MALTTLWDEDQQQWVLRGVARDPAVTAPLGRRCFSFPASADSPVHVIGFDDNFAEPVIVRAYYDPMADQAMRGQAKQAVFIGYVQIMQIRFRSTLPIPPSVYEGRLADRWVYEFSADHEFIDFMGPEDAKLRGVSRPLYPYNAMLMDGNMLRVYDPKDPRPGSLREELLQVNYPFFATGLENGSLYSSADFSYQLGQAGESQSVVASLAAEIAPGLTVPAHVRAALDDNHLLTQFRLTPTQLGSREPYQYAVDRLRTQTLPGDDGPWLAGVPNSDIVGQVIGGYVLLTLPDEDGSAGSGATLVISTKDDRGTDVSVHLLSSYETRSLFSYRARELFWRIWAYQSQLRRKADADEEMTIAPDPDAEMTFDEVTQPGTRGYNGLLTPPFRIKPDEPLIELAYWAIPVAYHIKLKRPPKGAPKGTKPTEYLTPVPHRGVQWTALLRYSEITGLLTMSGIAEPEPLRTYKTYDALHQFDRALKAESATTPVIDVSNFTKAAMRRDEFAGGVKLSFVDGIGEALPS